jgi:outer membrane protein assembly factor BamD (BamD/ComL family)
MALRAKPRRRYSGIVILLGILATPLAVGSDLFDHNDSRDIANLEFREAAFELYRYHYLSSLLQFLHASNLPGAVSGKNDNKAFLADFLYQQKDLSDIRQLLVAGRLADAPLSKDETDVVLADLYLAVGLPKPAEKLLNSVNGKRTAAPKHSWLAAGRFLYRRGYLEEAQQALAKLQDIPSGELQTQRDSLSALVQLAGGHDDNAIAILKADTGQGRQLALDRYNLGIALLDKGETQAGLAALDEINNTTRSASNYLYKSKLWSAINDQGKLSKERADTQQRLQTSFSAFLTDIATINLDQVWLNHGQTDLTATPLQDIKVDTPYANYALLDKGWIDFLQGNGRKALASWLPLSARDISDAAVQEGKLMTAYAYYQMHDYAQAMNNYQQAANGYEQELSRMQTARAPLIDGSYLKALLAENPGNKEFDTGWEPQTLPASPVTSYLLPILSSHRFVEGLKNYRDLLMTRDILMTAGSDIDASLDLLANQRAMNMGQRQVRQENSKQLDPNALLAKLKTIQSDLAKAEVHHSVMAFATVKQMQLLKYLNDAETLLGRLKSYIVDNDTLHAKYKLLRGLMIWDLTNHYPTRLQEVQQQLADLESILDKYASNYARLSGNPAQINSSFTAQEDNYKALRTRQNALLNSTETLVAQQAKYLEKLLAQGLQNGEDRLNDYLVQARLGYALTTDQVASASPAANKDYSATIAAYQFFLDHGGESLSRREVMFREAYLKMQQADNLDSAATGKNDRSDILYAEATSLLEQLLKRYPNHPDNDRVLYNLAKAYDHRGDSTTMLDTLDRLAKNYPHSTYIDEAQFRRGELLFSVGLPGQAAEAYNAVVTQGPASPLYDNALYKLGWSRFKQGQYQVAVNTFIPLLERKWTKITAAKDATTPPPTRSEEEMFKDILRGTSLSVAQIKGVDTLKDYFARHGARPYEYRLYETLAQLYIEQQRTADAVNVYRSFVTQHPNDPQAPLFDSLALSAYAKGGFIDLEQKAKADFIERYQPGAEYWQKNPNAARDATLAKVHDYLKEMTNYAHAKAQHTKNAADYQQAENWYRLFLQSFPADPLAANMHFLFAELLYEDHRYAEASQEYAKVAYEYKDDPNGAEAAYANVLAHEKLAAGLSGADKQAANQQALLALQRFTEAYPTDPRTPAALIKSAQQWFGLHEQVKAEQAAQRLLDIKPPAAAELRRDAWTILAHGQFDRQLFGDAERSYQQVLALTPKTDSKRPDIEENLAIAIYKQGEAARNAGDLKGAVQSFLRIKDQLPKTSIVATAQYDAAAVLLKLEDWQKAIPLLEAFRADYPGNPLQKDIAPKLAVAYQKTGDWRKAAGELESVAKQGAGEELQRDAVWQAAGLYMRAGQTKEAQRLYREYIQRFPKPVADAIEAQQHLADLYAQAKDTKQQHYWLQQIIDTDKQSGSERSERTRFLAGHAALILADTHYQNFIDIKLTHPLKKSLQHKKRVMEEALAAYRIASDYGIADVTTAATYRAAQIYSNLGKALLNSERPKGLSALELEQYNVLLEEQAYPFEEKAIALHEANAHRTTEHIYDDSVKQSFAALSKLLPGRYAKTEKGDAYVDAIY